MLPKKNRANTKAVDRIFKEGKFLNSPNLTFKYIKNTTKEIKISFIAPKSVAKLATKRNILRRRGYVALKNCLSDSPACITGVFIFKKYQADISILENEIKSIFDKIN